MTVEKLFFNINSHKKFLNFDEAQHFEFKIKSYLE